MLTMLKDEVRIAKVSHETDPLRHGTVPLTASTLIDIYCTLKEGDTIYMMYQDSPNTYSFSKGRFRYSDGGSTTEGDIIRLLNRQTCVDVVMRDDSGEEGKVPVEICSDARAFVWRV